VSLSLCVHRDGLFGVVAVNHSGGARVAAFRVRAVRAGWISSRAFHEARGLMCELVPA
jgi:hypothetical protein